jgi:hypothetical protein
MSLFNSYPKQLANIDGNFVLVTDIFRRVYAKTSVKDYTLLETITIPDNFTPEQIAHKYYENPFYHWVILVVNNIIDVREEWPKSERELVEYCKLKYDGLENLYETHHYINDEGVIVDADYTDGVKTAISNYSYEEDLNNAKREIQMLHPAYLSDFVSLYNQLIVR